MSIDNRSAHGGNHRSEGNVVLDWLDGGQVRFAELVVAKCTSSTTVHLPPLDTTLEHRREFGDLDGQVCPAIGISSVRADVANLGGECGTYANSKVEASMWLRSNKRLAILKRPYSKSVGLVVVWARLP